MRPQKLREIIEERKFEFEWDKLKTEYPERVDDFVEGAKWFLARRPERGQRIGNTGVCFIASESVRDILPMVIYYTFDQDYVNLLSIVETVNPPE
jgi:hypothetical protein